MIRSSQVSKEIFPYIVVILDDLFSFVPLISEYVFARFDVRCFHIVPQSGQHLGPT